MHEVHYIRDHFVRGSNCTQVIFYGPSSTAPTAQKYHFFWRLYVIIPKQGAIKNDLRTIWSPYKMIAYIMNFVHNDRFRTVHDDIQTVKIDIQLCAYWSSISFYTGSFYTYTIIYVGHFFGLVSRKRQGDHGDHEGGWGGKRNFDLMREVSLSCRHIWLELIW